MDKQHSLNEYRTGRAHHRKPNNSLITILLISVIFLTGLVSAMGLLNIRLFRQLNLSSRKDSPSLSFRQGDRPSPADYTQSVTIAHVTFCEISALYGQVYGLPAGLYVCYVEPGSLADRAGLRVGDVLTHVNAAPIARLAQLDLLAIPSANLRLFRNGTKMTIRIEDGK